MVKWTTPSQGLVTFECQHLWTQYLTGGPTSPRPWLCSQHSGSLHRLQCALSFALLLQEPNPGEHLSDRGRKGGVTGSWETLPRDGLPSHQAHRALPHSCSSFSLGNLSFEWLIMSFRGLELRCRPGVGAGDGTLPSASAESALLNRPSGKEKQIFHFSKNIWPLRREITFILTRFVWRVSTRTRNGSRSTWLVLGTQPETSSKLRWPCPNFFFFGSYMLSQYDSEISETQCLTLEGSHPGGGSTWGRYMQLLTERRSGRWGQKGRMGDVEGDWVTWLRSTNLTQYLMG